MSIKKKLLILGFGGHARSAADLALFCGYNELLFVDKNAKNGENFFGHPVISSIDALSISEWDIFSATGNNEKRKEQLLQIINFGLPPATLISPLASIGRGAIISAGCFIGHHSHIGSMAQIGTGCIINTGAIVEHECKIGDYSHVSVNSTIAGRSTLGTFCMLGAGATIIDGLNICDRVVIGSGGLVTKSITEPATYVGIPVKKLVNKIKTNPANKGKTLC